VTPPVLANEGRIGQVLVNLIVNSAHSFAEGRPETNEIRVTTRTDARGWAVVSVRDTGGGIAPENRERIFEPFFSTKEASRGTGLGLAVSRSIVESFGGAIHLTSELGHGSTFEVALPPAPTGATHKESLPGDADEPTKGRVLVVDDEPLVRRMLAHALQGEHEVSTCSDGREALELLARDHAFDVILCDVNMPRMSGREMYQALRERQPDVAERVVFSSGGSTDEETAAFLAEVANEQLSKPITLHALRSLVRRRLTH
jgi:CheY-like chemotaxis protein